MCMHDDSATLMNTTHLKIYQIDLIEPLFWSCVLMFNGISSHLNQQINTNLNLTICFSLGKMRYFSMILKHTVLTINTIYQNVFKLNMCISFCRIQQIAMFNAFKILIPILRWLDNMICKNWLSFPFFLFFFENSIIYRLIYINIPCWSFRTFHVFK